MNDWVQVQKHRQGSHDGIPLIRVTHDANQKTGRINLNKETRARLGNPEKVNIFVSRDAKRIMIDPAKTASPNTFTVGTHGTISAMDIVWKVDLPAGSSVSGSPVFENGAAILVVVP